MNMKKILYIASIFALASCAKINEVESYHDYGTDKAGSPITYSISGVEQATKASLTTNDNVVTKFPVMDVVAVLRESDMNKSPNTVVFSTTMDTATAKPTDTYYWADNNDDYTFYSIPKNAFVGETRNFHYDAFEARITVDRNTEDIVVARTTVSHGQKVNFEYNHIFTAVSVVYKKVQIGHTITAIRVVDTPKRGLCKVCKQDDGSTYVHWAAAKFSGTTTLEDNNVKYATINNTDLTAGTAKFMTIPTKNSGANIKVEVDIDGKTISATCGCKKAGDHVTFYIEDDLTFKVDDKSGSGGFIEEDPLHPGKYKLTLESYVTGAYKTVTNTVTKTTSAPTDFILLLDNTSSMKDSYDGSTKLQKLKDAANSFIGSVAKDSKDNSVEHRISIITFGDSKFPNYGGSSSDAISKADYVNSSKSGYLAETALGKYASVYKSFYSAKDNEMMLKSAITSMGGECNATAPEFGMYLAKLMLANCRTGVSKVIIFITDGQPTWKSSSWDDTYGSYGSKTVGNWVSANDAVKYAYECKQAGAKIFSVSIISSSNKNYKNFVEAVSSNYDNCNGFSSSTFTLSGATGTTYFYDAASSSTGLSNAFTKASTSITTTTTTTEVSVDVHNAYVNAIIADTFIVPDDFVEDYVKFYTVNQSGYDTTNKKVLWDSSTKTDITSSITCTLDSDNKTLNISGFDYAHNFCAVNAAGPFTGKKLVMEFSYLTLKTGKSLTDEAIEYSTGLYNGDDSLITLFQPIHQ